MQSRPIPILTDLVLVGGGHAHALVLRMWAMKQLAGVRLTIINPGPAAPYTGMLPGHIAGHYTRDAIMIDLVRLARLAGARLVLDRATGLDRAARRIHLAGRPPLAYDLLSLDIGIGSDLPQLPGFAEHAVAAKPLGAYAARWEAFLGRSLPAPHLVVIGAGVGGVELALASHHRLQQVGRTPKITLLEQAASPLANIGAGARRALLAHLNRAGIGLLTNASPAHITATTVELGDGRILRSDFTLAVAGARPHGWLADSGLTLNEGFVTISPTLQSSDPLIFAAGDCAHMAFAPRPKAGVFAVRQAPILLNNLTAALTGGILRQFRPQNDYLKLISTGGKRAVADKFGLRLDAGWLWRWKDRIDQRFMDKFGDYPAMPEAALPTPAIVGLAEALGAKPLCGGCGAKLGAADLSAALAMLPQPSRRDVLSGPGDDAAVLTNGAGVQVITTDHLRTFTSDARLMARITAIHALGDVWAMGASPQAALAQITLPALSPAKARDMLAEIMRAAHEVFSAAGADVVGGHSSIGAELTIGFTVTGLASRAVTKAGAKPGDLVILTKPLGTGVIMAAEMAMTRLPGMILGEAVEAALASMSRPLGPASAELAPHAHAMTDVTGFGLSGHLLEILDASGCGARLNADAIPILPGAMALSLAGQASSLAPANRQATSGRIKGLMSPVTDLMFDPQTAGGLLAVVAPESAAALLCALHAKGETATVIGEIIPGPPRIVLA